MHDGFFLHSIAFSQNFVFDCLLSGGPTDRECIGDAFRDVIPMQKHIAKGSGKVRRCLGDVLTMCSRSTGEEVKGGGLGVANCKILVRREK